jgi:SH3 domain protein
MRNGHMLGTTRGAHWWRKGFIGALLITGLALGTAEAATVYVVDSMQFTLRSGPGTDRKILAMVDSGTSVQILEPGDEWSLVRVDGGKEGYMLTRYLSPEKPSFLVLEELRQKHTALTEQAAGLLTENETLKAENTRLASELAEKSGALSQVTRTYDDLKHNSEASRFEMRKYMLFFFSGAAILFVGVMLGLVMKRSRRKSSLLS